MEEGSTVDGDVVSERPSFTRGFVDLFRQIYFYNEWLLTGTYGWKSRPSPRPVILIIPSPGSDAWTRKTLSVNRVV